MDHRMGTGNQPRTKTGCWSNAESIRLDSRFLLCSPTSNSRMGELLPDISRKRIEDGSLTFRDVADEFRATAADQAKDSKPSRLAKGSFGPSFARRRRRARRGQRGS